MPGKQHTTTSSGWWQRRQGGRLAPAGLEGVLDIIHVSQPYKKVSRAQ
jgi:hypothetical protein